MPHQWPLHLCLRMLVCGNEICVNVQYTNMFDRIDGQGLPFNNITSVSAFPGSRVQSIGQDAVRDKEWCYTLSISATRFALRKVQVEVFLVLRGSQVPKANLLEMEFYH